MAWTIDFDKKAKKEFASLDKSAQKQIDKFLLKLMKNANPKQLGEALKGNMQSFWRSSQAASSAAFSSTFSGLTVYALQFLLIIRQQVTSE
ncbi:MAG: hypothetical protein A3E85_00820 [Gammaproteobacteria bacterium RIFCSPHIGHO2_12_FULL_45_12]|nr:MAG: hypothetical protein A3E85_00820 [Gammaproteobacteria bacterium RIFCSPHIGHO2_12_FULL_45_12]